MNKFGQTLIILLLGIAIGGTYHDDLQLAVNKLIGFTNSETVSKVNQIELDEIKGSGSKVSICFTPSENCGQLIVDQITQAKKTIYMQAYGLTHPQITNALIKAKQRGVNVRILLDRSNCNISQTRLFSKLHKNIFSIDFKDFKFILHFQKSTNIIFIINTNSVFYYFIHI